MFTNVIILAGGIGERLWPLSTKEHPKQFIETDGITFFQMALKRAALLKPSCSILVVTRPEFKAITIEQCLLMQKLLTAKQFEFLLSRLTILLEPKPRHTAAAVQYALSYISRVQTADTKKDASVIVLTSDHLISTDAQFISSCKKAAEVIKDNHFVCFAVKPLFPSVEFGYIEAETENCDGMCAIKSFREKPDKKTAESFLARGNYWWNSGMFAFYKSFYESEIKKFVPALDAAFMRLLESNPREEYYKNIRVVQKWKNIDAVYDDAVAVSIDHAIAEKTCRARCVVAEFNWDDIGSWDVFAEHIPAWKNNAAFIESDNCSVYSEIPAVLCGVSNLIVAEKDGKLLIMQKGKSSLIREASARMEKQ